MESFRNCPAKLQHYLFSCVSDLWEETHSYNISKKYPPSLTGKWRQRLTGVFIFLAFTISTVFSLGTNGFELQTIYTTDPNGTQAEKHWYTNKIFTLGDDSLDPKCQSFDLPVGFEFMTTNQGLHYTVTSISLNPNPSSTSQQPIQRPSFSYLNNRLTDCEIDSVNMHMRKAGDNSDNFYYDWWSWMDSSADATAHCIVANEEGVLTITFSTSYQVLATLYQDTELYSYVAVDDPKARASAWWGSRMLNNYFVGTQAIMSANFSGTNYIRASMSFQRNSSATSVTSNNLFTLSYFFMAASNTVFNSKDDMSSAGVYNNRTFHLSRPLTEGLSFAKVYSSLILVDLGNLKASNVLLDHDLLQYALNASDDLNRQPGGNLHNESTLDWWKWATISPPGKTWISENGVRMSEAQSKFNNSNEMSPLGTKNASIYVQYICSVPQKKNTGTIFFFTLVANFSLFGVAWKLFKFLTDRCATKGPAAMYCEGCSSQGQSFYMVEDADDGLSRPSRAPRLRRHWSSSSSTTKALLQEVQAEELSSYE